MKKYFAGVLLVLLPFCGMTQETVKKNVQLGFTLTPNIGWLRFNSDNGTSALEPDGTRIGVSYGVLADFGLAANANYYFSTAFVVTSINGKSRVTTSPASTYLYKIQYIEVPVTLKLKSKSADFGRYYGQFGLGAGIKISAKGDGTTLIGNAVREDNNRNISDQINNFRLSLIAGGGVEWRVDKNIRILTGLTFNNGFVDIFDEEGEARNSYVALNLGVFF